MENWLPVVGFEGFYEVSDLGRVRSVERFSRSGRSKSGFRRVPSKIRSTNGLLNGYPAVHLSGGGRDQMRSVHTMVLEAFRGPRPSEVHEGCHGDGSKTNNALTNLRWGTKVENKADSFAHGTAVHGERSFHAKLTVATVAGLHSDPRSAHEIAKELGVCKTTIQRARNGRTWSRALSQEGARG